jgi:hypothetical protein
MTTQLMPICHVCKNLIDEYPFKCKAFPNRIPTRIIDSESDHRREFNGDGGIRFDPKDSQAESYAKLLFDK